MSEKKGGAKKFVNYQKGHNRIADYKAKPKHTKKFKKPNLAQPNTFYDKYFSGDWKEEDGTKTWGKEALDTTPTKESHPEDQEEQNNKDVQIINNNNNEKEEKDSNINNRANRKSKKEAKLEKALKHPNNPYSNAYKEHLQREEEKLQKNKEIEERRERNLKSQEKRKEIKKAYSKKTSKGQPVLHLQISQILNKLQSNPNEKK